MFQGLIKVNLDAKGRMAMPMRYRKPLTEESDGKVVVTIDPTSKCLCLYPSEAWEKTKKQVESLPNKPDIKRFKRLFLGYAFDFELDGSGRMLLPQELRDYAGLDKQLYLAGMGSKAEIWSEENWKAEHDAWDDIVESGVEMSPELLNVSF
ncbi:MAG: division/cell wall cluster transcriptional repressor MraZ [Pseudohongiellaceae bacterium]|nr:division/cell wall cluster transcriptional repressor MraZ [Pseudohongiellaceae bacterium]